MGYEPHTWDTGDVITAERLNALEQGAASGGDGYDIIVDCGSSLTETVSNYTVSWDYASVKAKVLAGELVTGIAFLHYNYDDLIDGDTNIEPIPLVIINIYSSAAAMIFSLAWPTSSSSNTSVELALKKLQLAFSPSDGTLTDASYIAKRVVLT